MSTGFDAPAVFFWILLSAFGLCSFLDDCCSLVATGAYCGGVKPWSSLWYRRPTTDDELFRWNLQCVCTKIHGFSWMWVSFHTISTSPSLLQLAFFDLLGILSRVKGIRFWCRHCCSHHIRTTVNIYFIRTYFYLHRFCVMTSLCIFWQSQHHQEVEILEFQIHINLYFIHIQREFIKKFNVPCTCTVRNELLCLCTLA